MRAGGQRSPLVLRLEEELRQRLEKLAKAEEGTLSEAVRRLLREGLTRRASEALDAQPDAPDILSILMRMNSDLARLQGVSEEQARAVFGMEQLLCYWASRSAYDASQDALQEELRQVGEEELRRVLSHYLEPETLESE